MYLPLRLQGYRRMFNYDPHTNGVQFLEDIATAYWSSQVLFTAVEMEIFTAVEKGGTLDFLSSCLLCDQINLKRLLEVLVSMGLLTKYEGVYYNTEISRIHLVKGKPDYQGNSILWRKSLMNSWEDLKNTVIKGKRINYIDDEKSLAQRTQNYIKGMNDIAHSKSKEIVSFFSGLQLQGDLLDIGAGSGVVSKEFVEKFNGLEATLVDLEQVNKITQRNFEGDHRYKFNCKNILEDWEFLSNKYDLIILSNIIHAYSEPEVKHIIKQGLKFLKDSGYLIIHDFFMEHYAVKPQMFDLNMMINTYNGKVFEGSWVINVLDENLVYNTGLVPLRSDTAVIIASKNKNKLRDLNINKTDIIMGELKTMGFRQGISINTEDIVLSQMAVAKCKFGCEYYGKGNCPPNSLNMEETRKLMKSYNKGIILEGEPPTKSFQNILLKLEKKAFNEGFYKALVFWAGPCSLCEKCTGNGEKCTRSRSSMEGSGIDVFETVRRLGINLKTLDDSDYVKYFGLLLLE